MKILFVADVSIAKILGGAERVLRHQSVGLVGRGHEVHILTRRNADHRCDDEMIDGVHEWRYPIDSSNDFNYLMSTLRNAKRAGAQLLKRIPFDVINSHQPFTAFAVGNIPTPAVKIYTCHSLSFEEYQTRAVGASFPMRTAQTLIRKHIEKTCLSSCQKIIVLSRFSHDKLVHAYGIDSSHIRVIPGGVDTDRFLPVEDKAKAKQALGIAPDEFSLFTLRNLVPRMGLDRLIDAIALVKPKIPRLRLYIGGDGPLRQNLEDQCRRLNLEQTVSLIGFMEDDRVRAFCQMADFFILPTMSLEGFGLVTVEALACGTPVLATPIGATPEILDGLGPNLLSYDASAPAIAQLIEQHYHLYSADREAYRALCRACRQQAVERYSWPNNIQQTEKVFVECAASAAKSN